ncbi:Aminoacyl tRNA synthase complex-interacting multifunctional protein 1 [Actinomortierella ambigua]|uniref:Aminoacyl tRNA synthase complex-interacting multifunctional protein 1 n=1 Tax=Actinomortierella ambigua TaxID=1343610 RepID=A0A9P6U035_9FUNG|nr:Aminoacyl tRNA synthase complex-interacting multifunctional protein 1 [Actinomortierella ambigua]
MMLGCGYILKKAPSSSACRAPGCSSSVTGFRGTLTSLHRATCQGRTRAHHHTWITGHPHRIAFNNNSTSLSSATSAGNASAACSSGSIASAGASAHAAVSSGTLMDFAGNSRFLANHLARFSTLSTVSSASSPSSSSSSPATLLSPAPSQQQQQQQQQPRQPESAQPSGSTQQGSSKAQEPSQDTGSGSVSGSSSGQTKFGTSATKASTEDKDDDAWEVNESYSGHGSGGTRGNIAPDSRKNQRQQDGAEPSLSPAPTTPDSSSSSASTGQNDTQDTHHNNNHQHGDDDDHSTLRPSLSSFKDAASIKKSWRRTSDQLSHSASSPSSSSSSSPPQPSPTPAGSTAGSTLSRSGGQSQAGQLDLSSSTLVQQMLFGDRRPPSSGTEEAEKRQGDQASKDATATAEGKDDDIHLHNKGGSHSPLQDALFSRDRRRRDEEDEDTSLSSRSGGDESDDIEDDQQLERARRDILLQSEIKTESPSLEELLDLAANNAGENTATTSTTSTTATATPLASSSATMSTSSSSSTGPVTSPKTKKETSHTNMKTGSGAGEEEEDHISKLDIRVGVVRSVERHPDAESLYVEQVDVGDGQNATEDPSTTTTSSSSTRTIVSGLVKHIPKDYLEGRAVIVVRNMKPSKLRGIASHGMLLCGMEKDSDGSVTKVELLEPAEGSQPGDKVVFEGFTDESK